MKKREDSFTCGIADGHFGKSKPHKEVDPSEKVVLDGCSHALPDDSDSRFGAGASGLFAGGAERLERGTFRGLGGHGKGFGALHDAFRQPRGITTYSPEIEGTTSFETVRLVDVTAHGRTEQWRLRVVPTDVTVRITQCDAWARIAWLAADGLSDTEMGFVYRRKGDTEWLAVPDVEIEGGTFRAKLAGLDPETTYELKAFPDTDLSDMREFTTEAALQLPNAGFETWSTDRKSVV